MPETRAQAPAMRTTHPRSERAGWLSARLAVYVVVVVLVALAVRLPYFPRTGNGYDLEEYRRWTAAIQQHGLASVFDYSSADYVGYLYLLWGVAQLHDGDLSQTTLYDQRLHRLLKVPGLIGDAMSTVVIIGLTASITARTGARPPNPVVSRAATRLRLTDAEALGLGAGLLWALHPAVLYAGVYWGQQDSLVMVFALGAVWAALRRRPGLAAGVLIAGATLKPQPMLIAPVLAWVILRRSGLSGAARAAVSGLAVLIAGHLYFVATGNLERVLEIYRDAVFTPQRLSFSAYNLWWPVARNADVTSADTAFSPAGIDVAYGDLASLLVLAVVAVTIACLRRRDDDAAVLAACGYLIVGYFTVGSGIHERYNIAALTFLVPLMVLQGRWALPVLLLSLTATANAVLTLPFQRLYAQGQPEWLPNTVALANVALLGWMTVLLWGPERERSAHDITPPDSTPASARR